MVIAAADEVVGAAQGPKLLIVMEGAGHNSIGVQPEAAWFRQTSEFLLRSR